MSSKIAAETMILPGAEFSFLRSINTRIVTGTAVIAKAVPAKIVVFQQDIRRAFERLAVSGWFGRAEPAALAGGVIATLVEAVDNLAENHTGALIVIEGRGSLDHHVHGGVAVDGHVSLPCCTAFSIRNRPDTTGRC